MNVNKVILLGRLTAVPEIKQTGSGKSVLNVNLAVSKRLDDGRQFDQRLAVVIWGKQAEFLQAHGIIGSTVYIEGELQNRSYDKAGTTVWVTEVIANRVQMMWEDKPEGMKPDDSNWNAFGIGGAK